ncbi:MAG: efflux RND transporter periplasmic adaptor subunit [Bacteroidales bacterium]|jgi:RND family efflux transporter MFP subunit|nr:efflux RND transporter periplasmic adaptor subunit [Bacteroidales bacterium]
MSKLPAIFIILLLGFISCKNSKKDSKEQQGVSTVLPEQTNQVKVMRLEYSDFTQELVSNGTISARRKANLRFEVQGLVTSIEVKNGDRVAKGQKIAALDHFKLTKDLQQAKDNLERSRLSLLEILAGQGYAIGDTASVPADIMQIAKVRSNFDQASIQCELADCNLKNSVLYAPFDGIIANLFTKEYNTPSSSEAFCTVLDHQSMEVSFTALESELSQINTGDRVLVTPYAHGGASVEGRISEINPVVEQNGVVKMKATLSNPNQKLYDGMNSKILIQRTLGKQLVIPKSALVLRTNRKVVFTYKDRRAKWNYVETGAENSTGYVVTTELAVGDSVIYDGNINLAHETPVELTIDN